MVMDSMVIQKICKTSSKPCIISGNKMKEKLNRVEEIEAIEPHLEVSLLLDRNMLDI